MAEGHLISIPPLPRAGSTDGYSLPVAKGAAPALAEPRFLRERTETLQTQHPPQHRAAVALRVLVVEDDPPVRHACSEIASGLGFAVETADSVPAAKLALKRNPVDILLLDLKLPGGGGFSLLQEVREKHPRTASIVMTAFASVTSVVEAMRTGAGDYLPKPFTVEELSSVLERAAERRNAFDESRASPGQMRHGTLPGMPLGHSPAMEKLFRMVSKVAYTNHPVLILGESGTGKETVARAIHANGPQAAKPFIPVDCGSLLPSLMASELFGHAKGAFPEASAAKTGLLTAVAGGTVFLDEIGDLPLDLQARLLRALQEKEVRPSGALTAVAMNARILAATNRDLAAMVETGRFRKDLFYRLNVVNIRIPPLRERLGDVPLLAAQMLESISRDRGIPYSFAESAFRAMVEYAWPGNIRELEHVVERACTLSSGPVIHLTDPLGEVRDGHLPDQLAASTLRAGADPASYRVVPIVEVERHAILNTLRQLKGDKLLAARMLGIGKTTLYRKLKEYGIHDELLA